MNWSNAHRIADEHDQEITRIETQAYDAVAKRQHARIDRFMGIRSARNALSKSEILALEYYRRIAADRYIRRIVRWDSEIKAISQEIGNRNLIRALINARKDYTEARKS